MRLFISLAVVALLTAAIITGCSGNNQPANVAVKGSNSSPSNASAPPADNVRRMTITELRDALDQGKAVVVDVRGDAMYNQEHIKGSLNIPESQIVSRAGELPKDKLIVLYCS
jgi:3-mercaptopyruvate sulfurtransferase SseA